MGNILYIVEDVYIKKEDKKTKVLRLWSVDNMVGIQIGSKLKEIVMGGDEWYGKYPHITFKFDNFTSINFGLSEDELKLMKKRLNQIEIYHGRYYDKKEETETIECE